jgi:type I site-specific restriction endonuclease
VAKLADVLAREETMEHQQSRISWLRDGDRNTTFFQAKARAQNRTNRIKMLTDDAGNIFTEQEDLERLACQFYQNLFSAQKNFQPELIYQYVPQKVTPEMSQLLEQPFTELEVESALFQMAPNKSPGVDGFNAGFFQTHWQLVMPCIVSALLGFLNGGISRRM